MYIDKLYNKLFSDGNTDGINVLMNEIKAFSALSDRDKKAKENADEIIRQRGIHCNKTKKLIRKQMRANVRGDRN